MRFELLGKKCKDEVTGFQGIATAYDQRDTSFVYYLNDDNQLEQWPLNADIPENISYAGMTWKRYGELQLRAKEALL